MIELDGTPNKSRLGANAILGVSLAAAKAAADARGLPLYRYVGGVSAHVLPVPMMNIINGGAHADNPIDFQEFMIMPVGAPTLRRGGALGRRDLPHAEEAAARRGPVDRGRRRGRLRAESRARRADALDFIMASIEAAGYRPGDDVVLALDCAATEFFRDGAYEMDGRGAGARRPPRWPTISPISPRDYPIASIEDGMAEDDFDGWKALTDRLGDDASSWSATICSSPIPKRLREGIEPRPGQFAAGQGQPDRHADRDAGRRSRWRTARGYTAVMSHRSGETEDATIADLAVATNCGQIKTGSLARSDRLAKYNQLIRIEEELGDSRASMRAGRFCS